MIIPNTPPRYNSNIVESGVKPHKPPPPPPTKNQIYSELGKYRIF